MRDIDPMPPGEILLEDFRKPMGITQYRLAKSIKVPASRIHDVVHCKRPITAELALRLARFFGTDAQSWVNLQARGDRTGSAGEEGSQAARGVIGQIDSDPIFSYAIEPGCDSEGTLCRDLLTIDIVQRSHSSSARSSRDSSLRRAASGASLQSSHNRSFEVSV
jgi:addiction module HigA family antidote